MACLPRPAANWPGIVAHYRDLLPVSADTRITTLLEGCTPLLPAPRLAARIAFGLELWIKVEGANPTGSFKDRGMTLAVSKALSQGYRQVVCASTGNTSASAAAYAARAGMVCGVVIPQGKIAQGKLAQALLHGARVLAIEGNFDRALTLVRKLCEKYPVALVNSVNPDRIAGQTTVAFEICDALGDAPEFLAIPVGNAGNITAAWLGFTRYFEAGKASRRPRMLGFQAEGAAPLVHGGVVENPDTVATAIRIGNPASREGALRARDESGGLFAAVSDAEILAAQRLLAREEGIAVEPASAASVAGLLKLGREGFFQKPAQVVAVVTGHGLKDPEAAMAAGKAPTVVKAEMEAVVGALGM